MSGIKISQLTPAIPKNKNILLMYDVEEDRTCTVSIEQLLGMQQEALQKECKHCGNIGSYDSRGNCGCCGAPKGTL